MRNKLVTGIVSLLFGVLILISLIIPWWNEALGIFGPAGTFYPLSTPTIPQDMPRYLSYITGILIIVSGISAIVFGSIMIYKKKSQKSNIGSVIAGIIGIVALIVYIIFIYKVSPDLNGHVFYFSSYAGVDYGLQAGFYVEGISSFILFVFGLVSLA
ncbi:MAG: hypothetical protein M1581_04840 [Candidatus Thermoplasmatota archaeon]|nr:hypothetical protein [Candidatus Thermoplasmatota archaeon]